MRELQHWRQAKGQQQRHADAQAEQRRQRRGGGQHRVHQAVQQLDKDEVQRKADHHAAQAGDQADRAELQRIGAGNRPLRRAQHPQHRAVVEVALGIVARRNRHRHGGQQRRQQRHQVQEALCPVERLAHLGAAGFERLQPQAGHRRGLALGLHPGGVGGDLVLAVVGRRHRQAVGDAAGRLHQGSRCQVGGVEHHPWRKVHEACATVGLLHDHLADGELRVAQQQRIADGQPQHIQQAGLDPDLATRRAAGPGGDRPVALGAQLHRATQRVVGVDHLQ